MNQLVPFSPSFNFYKILYGSLQGSFRRIIPLHTYHWAQNFKPCIFIFKLFKRNSNITEVSCNYSFYRISYISFSIQSITDTRMIISIIFWSSYKVNLINIILFFFISIGKLCMFCINLFDADNIFFFSNNIFNHPCMVNCIVFSNNILN